MMVLDLIVTVHPVKYFQKSGNDQKDALTCNIWNEIKEDTDRITNIIHKYKPVERHVNHIVHSINRSII